MKGGIHWYYDSLTPGIAIFNVVIHEALEYIAEDIAKDIEEYMKSEAPWEDRTGAARDGLTAQVRDSTGSDIIIDLFYTVDYGIWLEVRFNGQFAIILPTLERYGPMLMGAFEATFEVAG
jgi:hypothetical protein